MKYYPKLGLYKASNVSFNPETCEAYSYGWWRFVDYIGPLLVFNNYKYSNSTIKHQYKVKQLMNTLRVSIDLDIECPGGLQDLDSAIKLYKDRIAALEKEIAKPRSREAKNAERRMHINELEVRIKEVEMLIRLQTVERVA